MNFFLALGLLLNGPTITYQAPVIVAVTAYSELDSCHSGPDCLMASGKRAYVGAVACPRDVKLGDKVVIDGKNYTCEDRTAQKYDGRYDIFMGYGEESHKKALNFGIKHLEISQGESYPHI